MAPSTYPPFEYFNVTFPAPYVAHVEINRPKKLNSFFGKMWPEMKAIFERVSTDPEVRCVLFSGAGDRAFTSGLDVDDATQPGNAISSTDFIDASRRAAHLRRHILELQDCVSSVARCGKPVIALLHGFTYGLGIDLASACDIRLCLDNTKFCVKEVDVGLAADVGTLSRLPKVVGGLTGWVKEVCFTARPFSAEEASKNNFVNKVVSGGKQELVKEGIKLASHIASKSPVAVQGTKNILDASWGRTVEDNLNYTATWNMAMLQSTDVQRAMTSSLQKRVPTFEKL